MKASAIAVLIIAVASVSHAALPAPPFDFTVTPSAVVEGNSVTIHIASRGPRQHHVEDHDLYLALAFSEEASFLTADGTWSPRPVPFARAPRAEALSLVRPWPKAWPPGDHALALLVVPASANPLARTKWCYRPVITWLSITPRAADVRPATSVLSALAGLTVIAVATVWWTVLGGRRPDH